MKSFSFTTNNLARWTALAALLLAALALATPGQAQTTEYFSAASNTLWDASTADWSATSGGPYTSDWTSGNNPVFEGTGGTVTQTANTGGTSMTFNATGYTITGSNLTLGSNPSILVAPNDAATISSNIKTIGTALTVGNVSNTGTLTLAGGNQFAGPTTVSYGTVVANNAQSFGISSGYHTITINHGGQVQLSGGVTLSSKDTFSVGGGTLGNNSGTNTIQGTVTANAGNPYLVSSAGLLTLSNATAVNNNSAATRTIFLQGAGNGLISGSIAPGSGNFLVTMDGTGTWTLAGSNNYTGATTINSGVLQFAQTNAMPASSTVTVSGGATLAVNAGGAGEFTPATSGSGSIGGLLAGVGGQNGPVTWNAGAILGIDTTNAPGGSLAYTGTIGDSGANSRGLTKLGDGQLTLSAKHLHRRHHH